MENKYLQGHIEFDGFRLDVAKRRLFFRDQTVQLTPKEFDVLHFLIANSDRVVDKSELLDKIWPETFVEEATLTRNISWLRKKLAAHAGDELVIIETLPKRGYRFLRETDAPRPESEPTSELASAVGANKAESLQTDRAERNQSAGRTNSSRWLIAAAVLIAIGIAGGWWLLSGGRRDGLLHTSRIVPFSGNPGREESPSFSPDGKLIVYCWDGGVDDAGLDIYIRMVDGGDPVRLTKTPEDELHPVFSPDGKTIAFVRHFVDHNEILLIPAFGGAERLIDPKASYASLSYSPDGTTLAAAELSFETNAAGIYLINIASGERRRLTTPEVPVVDHTPRYSPDGKQISFIRYFGSLRREIFVVPSSGGEPRQLTRDDTRIYGATWDEDGASLFFSSFRQNGQLNLWQIPVAGGEPRLVPTGSREIEGLAMSPDGRTIAFADEITDENIWELGSGTPHPVIRSTRSDHSPQLSPNGLQLVFSSDRSGIYQIWISNIDGTAQRQITNGEMPAGSPRFSPDGKTIAFDGQTSNRGDVYLVSSDGGEPRRLTDGVSLNYLPSWSADGKAVYFVSERSGSAQLWRVGVDGGDARIITTSGAFESMAAADGRIYYSKGPGKAGIWSVAADGGDEAPVNGLEQAGVWRSWYVGQGGIYFTSFSPQPPFSISFFDFNSGISKTVATVEKIPLLYYSNLTGTPDGRRLFFARQDQSKSSIMLAKLDR